MMISPVYYKYTKGATLGRGSLGQGSLGPKKIGNFLEGKSMGPRLFQGNLGWWNIIYHLARSHLVSGQLEVISPKMKY